MPAGSITEALQALAERTERMPPSAALDAQPAESAAEPTPPSVMLDTLPAQLVQHLLAIGGSSRAADAISCVCRQLSAAVAASGALVMQLCGGVDEAASCSAPADS